MPIDMPFAGLFSSRLVLVEDDLLDRVHRRGGDLHARFPAGEWRGQWRFALSAEGRPTTAWRDIDDSGASEGYRVERIGYCKGERPACEQWFETERHRAPRPTARAGTIAFQQWRHRVLEEPCLRQPEFLPSRAAMQAAHARSQLGDAEIVLEMTLNACGEVRDVFIRTASGDDGLDRAALAWARRARFTTTYEFSAGEFSPARGTVGILPIRFKQAD